MQNQSIAGCAPQTTILQKDIDIRLEIKLAYVVVKGYLHDRSQYFIDTHYRLTLYLFYFKN